MAGVTRFFFPTFRPANVAMRLAHPEWGYGTFGRSYPHKSFRCNTYGSPRKCCKQKTYGLAKPFRCNTYKKQGEGEQLLLTRNSKKNFYPEEHRDEGSLFTGRGTRISVRHRADFFFDLGNIDHDDGVPRAAIQEAAVRAFTEALLAPDALEGVNLDASERRIVLVRHPEHAIFHRAVLHASRRSRATRAALGDYGQFLRLFLACGGNTLRARFKFLVVGHHSWSFDDFGCVCHFQ